MRQHLVVDEPAPRVRADNEARHAQPVALRVDARRRDVVVKTAPVVPAEEDRRRRPVLAAHHRVDEARHVRLAARDERGRVLAHRLRGRDPRHCRQLPRPGGSKKRLQRRDVLQLPVLSHGVEVRQRVPDARCRRLLRDGRAEHRVVGAPRNVVLVQQIREIGPRVVGSGARRVLRVARRRARSLHRAPAAHRVAGDGAFRRPAGDHVQVRGQAPREIGLEHVILEDEVPRVRPVVRDLVPVVVPHDVGRPRRERARRRVDLRRAGRPPTRGRLQHEAVHVPRVDVADRVHVVVRAAGVAVGGVVVRAHAAASARHRHAHALGNAVGARIRAEVGVERPVLLHDHDDVPDQVDAGGPAARARRASCQPRGHKACDHEPPHASDARASVLS